MPYQGDYRAADVVYFKFTTRRFSTGAPYTLAGTPALSVYKDDGTTESTSGITLTADFDSRTGLNQVKIDTSSDGTFYAEGHDFDVVITTGTVDSVSVVGEVIGSFSLANRSPLRPTTKGRTLDVSAGGEAGLDWANVGSPTTAVDLSGTTIKTTQKVDVDTIKTQAVTLAGGVTFPAATLASTTNITAGTITTATNVTTVNGLAAGVITATAIATDAIGSDELAASAISEIQSGLSTLDAAGVRSAVGLASANLDTQLDALPTATENADALLKRDWTAVTGEAARSVLNALRFVRNKWSLSGTTLTVTKEDDATSAWVSTVTTDAAADPITGSDPA